MAGLTLNHVTKRFEDVVAVDDVSMDIDDGEFLVLVGPSGCGKSTTLRMIAGLETLTEGDIDLGERSIAHAKPADRDIAMVFQSYALYPHMTVRGNMRFGLEESTDLSDEEIDARVEETAAKLDIEELLDRRPGELSGGQQQRVALGRAIVRDPAVFLMDEPLSNLDAKLRSQMRTELQRLQEELAVTTVYVTHDQTEAMTMGDRIAVLNDGELMQVGTPLECYHAPANEFVAGFIGEPSMNFFAVEREGDTLTGDGFEYPLSNDVATDLGETRRLTLGVRPEDVSFVPSADGPHDLPAVTGVVEPMGNENNVHLTFPDGSEEFVATVDGMEHVERDQHVVARVPEAAIHLFDRETGRTLRNRSLAEMERARARAD
ncbi:ABC transporter ATP-binding protein [Halomarina ordinaria]|uniref:ABC-type D-xylose/L-arabinose transporter n=1 Tax=Halomarina ordinaria TaxID=3033939 RepID=A0ABD5U6F8_9EURY|nr:sn-glycerol-3-phosphate ABC transporter ATP-binding protein UgpC [Halomarina sp. PSRA2]